ncbi:hypothetical protein J6590_074059 [Homalodisca vitripennis]|nr:hypothetical protein J6590_074059 [Homalodisca vitripennis]
MYALRVLNDFFGIVYQDKQENIRLEKEVVACRNKSIIVDGIPEKTNENLRDILCKLSDVVDVPIDVSRNIQAFHMLPTKRKNVLKSIILQFTNTEVKTLFMSKGKKPRIESLDVVRGVPTTRVYVNEHLTPNNGALLYHAKKLKKCGYKNVWAVDGNIFTR